MYRGDGSIRKDGAPSNLALIFSWAPDNTVEHYHRGDAMTSRFATTKCQNWS